MSHRLHRRDLLLGSASLAGLLAAPVSLFAAEGGERRERQQEYYELRIYRCPTTDKRRLMEAYLEKALVPAVNRLGLERVGVFTALDKPEDATLYAIIPFPTLELWAQLGGRLAADAAYVRESQAQLALPKNDPAFVRIDARLFRAFTGMPVMELPAQTAQRGPRIFEMRIYESHNEERAATKVAMFNEGEIQVMRDTGLSPLLFGEALAGGNLPNLTYILSAENMDAHQAHWKVFRAHPEWLRIKDLPRFKDAVSKIESIFLAPTGFSQI